MRSDEKMGRFLLGITSLMVAICWMPAYATHELDHRFTIYGTVWNGEKFPGLPLSNQEVVVQDGKTKQVIQRGVTDADGKYALLLHVHNGDVGKVVWLQSSGISKRVTLQFDPGDVTTERRTQVDLVIFPPPTAKPVSPSQ